MRQKKRVLGLFSFTAVVGIASLFLWNNHGNGYGVFNIVSPGDAYSEEEIKENANNSVVNDIISNGIGSGRDDNKEEIYTLYDSHRPLLPSEGEDMSDEDRDDTDDKKGKESEPVKAVANPRTDNEDFHAGVNVLVYGDHYEDLMDLNWKADWILDRLIDMNVNSVSINFPLFQDSYRSSVVKRDDVETPSNEELQLFIRKAHKRGFTVVLRPLLDEKTFIPDGQWRGTIRPDSPERWFEAYGELIVEYAELAEEEDVEIFGIGAELVSMERYTNEWSALIGDVRRVYTGEVTYAGNSSVPHSMPWEQLDFISIDAFFKLGLSPDSSTEEIEEAWKQEMDNINEISDVLHKDIVFMEVGTTSQRGSFVRPWLWDPGNEPSPEDQAKYYEATCNAVAGDLLGMYWWVVYLWLPEDGEKDTGFTMLDKPAEEVVEKCYASSS